MKRLTFLWCYYLLNCVVGVDGLAVVVTLPVLILCSINILMIKSEYFTFRDMVWFCAYLFFAIAPVQAISGGYINPDGGPTNGIFFSTDEIVGAMMIPICFFGSVTVVTILNMKSIERPLSRSRYTTIDRRTLALLFVVNIVTAACFVFLSGGLENVLSPRHQKTFQDTQEIALIALSIQVVSEFMIVAAIVSMRKTWFALSMCGLTLGLLAISQNPYNAPRFYVIASWLPLVFILLHGRIRAVVFYGMSMVGILILMPIMSLTSRFGVSLSEGLSNVNITKAFFNVPYIDVIDMHAYEIKFISQTGMYWGEKTIGALLFFIPRSLWPGKADLLALEMGRELVYFRFAGTENLSLFVGGEFYADFGYLGVIVGAALLTAFVIKIAKFRVLVQDLDILRYIFIAATPILMRGPIGAVASLSFVEFFAFWVLLILISTLRPRRARDAGGGSHASKMELAGGGPLR